MRRIASAAVILCATFVPATAQQVAQDKVLVLACLENLDDTTTWPQCLELMFQPCVAHPVGGADHVACLTGQRAEWSHTMEVLQTDVFNAITIPGGSELADVMGQWTGYVGQKCQAVAAARTQTGPESARLGCEITEMAGLSGEFAACLEGRSSAPYCQFKEN